LPRLVDHLQKTLFSAHNAPNSSVIIHANNSKVELLLLCFLFIQTHPSHLALNVGQEKPEFVSKNAAVIREISGKPPKNHPPLRPTIDPH